MLVVALDRVLDYGEVLNVPQADERNRVVECKGIMLFDMDAYYEAIINSVVHNLWVTGNDSSVTVDRCTSHFLARHISHNFLHSAGLSVH